MKVAQISEISKSRMKVCTDQGHEFILYKGELRRFRIREGEELAGEDLRAILEDLLPKRAKLRAMNLLQNRDYTVRQLRDKLVQGGYSEDIVQEALDYVASFRYTDDLRYAVHFIQNHADDRSRRRIECDLLGRGIDRPTLAAAWAQWEEDGGSQDEQAQIQALLEKKGFERETASPGERRRMCAFLTRKGFSCEQVLKAMQIAQEFS